MSSAKRKFKRKTAESQVKTDTGTAILAKTGKDMVAVKQRRPGVSSPLFPGSWQLNWLLFGLLVLGTAILYTGDLHLGFFGVDDPDYVVKNPWIRSINGQNIKHILTTPYFANYSPAHLFSYMFDYAIADDNAFAFHLSSNIWAGIVAGFVFSRRSH